MVLDVTDTRLIAVTGDGFWFLVKMDEKKCSASSTTGEPPCPVKLSLRTGVTRRQLFPDAIYFIERGVLTTMFTQRGPYP